jgi:hypothetical protein
LINHQAFGPSCPGFNQVLRKYGSCLDNRGVLDDLDAELLRRSHIDQSLDEPVNASQGGDYAGLSLTVFHHLEYLCSVGFVADEIWRKGSSAMIMAVKSSL